MGFRDEREYENNKEDEGCGRGDVQGMLQLEYLRYVREKGYLDGQM